MADELRAHVEHRADDLIASGVAPEEAFRRARIELGAIETHKESIRDERVFGRARRFAEQTGRDLRFALRRLARAPVFTFFAISSIGVGAGVTTAVFAVVYATFWAPLGVREPDTLALVANQLQGAPAVERAMSRPDFEDYRRGQQSFAWIGGITRFYQAMSTNSGTVLAQGEAVSGDYFQQLGVVPMLGRVLQPADDGPDAPSVAVLSHQFWRARFAGDEGVVGRVVRLGGIPVEIVGIAPRGFRGINPLMIRSTPLWVPTTTLARMGAAGLSPRSGDPRERLSEVVVGRLKPGVTVGQASAEAGRFSASLDETNAVTQIVSTREGPERRVAPRRWIVRGLVELGDGPGLVNGAGVAMLAIIGLVLAVACSNLANLALARGAGREQELAVRLALGASRWRLVRELTAESILVGAAGLALAVLISVPLMRLAASDTPMFNGMSAQADPHLDGAVLAAAAWAVGIALVVCGLWPAWRLSRADVRTTIAQGGPSGTPRWRTERSLIRAQVIVSVAFFSVSAVFISAMSAESRHDPGVDLDRLTVAYAAFRLQATDEARMRRSIDAIVSTDARSRGFRAVAATSSVPFGSTVQLSARVWLDDVAPAAADSVLMASSTPGIFSALGIPIVHGRAFDGRDSAGAIPAAVVSESLARRLFGTADAVGRQFRMQGGLNARDDKTVERRTVVGVSRDTDVGSLMNRSDHAFLFVPIAQRFEPPNFVVAQRADPAGTTGALRALIHAADEDLAVDAAGSGFVMLGGVWNAARILAWVAFGLGALTLVLTMAGLFGVLSHLVLRRTREIGIRMALGADVTAIRWMVIRDGARPVASGALVGLLLGVAGGFLVRAALPVNAPPVQPLAILIVILAIVPATLAACYFPARRAAQVDPNLTLKNL